MTPALVVVAGLPGVGKTTVSRAIARRTGAAHLRIDTIETALSRRAVSFDGANGDMAYVVAYAQARDLLALGQSVIVDAVHGWPEARTLWTAAVAGLDARLVLVEMTCSDRETHRTRVETRRPDLHGLALPTWEAVLARRARPMSAPTLHLDTARLDVSAAAERIISVFQTGE